MVINNSIEYKNLVFSAAQALSNRVDDLIDGTKHLKNYIGNPENNEAKAQLEEFKNELHKDEQDLITAHAASTGAISTNKVKNLLNNNSWSLLLENFKKLLEKLSSSDCQQSNKGTGTSDSSQSSYIIDLIGSINYTFNHDHLILKAMNDKTRSSNKEEEGYEKLFKQVPRTELQRKKTDLRTLFNQFNILGFDIPTLLNSHLSQFFAQKQDTFSRLIMLNGFTNTSNCLKLALKDSISIKEFTSKISSENKLQGDSKNALNRILESKNCKRLMTDIINDTIEIFIKELILLDDHCKANEQMN